MAGMLPAGWASALDELPTAPAATEVARLDAIKSRRVKRRAFESFMRTFRCCVARLGWGNTGGAHYRRIAPRWRSHGRESVPAGEVGALSCYRIRTTLTASRPGRH